MWSSEAQNRRDQFTRGHTSQSARQGQGRVYEVFRLVAAMPLSMAAYSSLACNWRAKCESSSDYILSQVKLGADCAGTSFATEVRLSEKVKPIGKSGQRIALEVLTKALSHWHWHAEGEQRSIARAACLPALDTAYPPKVVQPQMDPIRRTANCWYSVWR